MSLRKVFCFLLLLCAAIFARAEGKQASTCEVKTYIVKHGDRLIPISYKHFGGESYIKLAASSGIENPHKIWPGNVIRNFCPRTFCCYDGVNSKPVSTVASISEPQIGLGETPKVLPTATEGQFDFSVAPAPEILENVATVAEPALSLSEAEQMLPALAVADVSIVKNSKLVGGVYNTFTPNVGLPEGRYPAYVVRNQKNAVWQREETSVLVERVGNDLLSYKVKVKNPTKDDIVAFEFQSNVGTFEMGVLKRVKSVFPSQKLGKKNYAELDKRYPTSPSGAVNLLKVAGKVAPPILLTYFTGGIWPAAIAGGNAGFQGFVHRKAKQETVSQAMINQQLVSEISELRNQLAALKAQQDGKSPKEVAQK